MCGVDTSVYINWFCIHAASLKFDIFGFLQENEKTKDIIIEQRFHRTIIGAKGEKIREIRDKYPEVQISFPDAGKKSDIVNLRGPREDVDNVYTLLKKLNAELVSLNQCCWMPMQTSPTAQDTVP